MKKNQDLKNKSLDALEKYFYEITHQDHYVFSEDGYTIDYTTIPNWVVVASLQDKGFPVAILDIYKIDKVIEWYQKANEIIANLDEEMLEEYKSGDYTIAEAMMDAENQIEFK